MKIKVRKITNVSESTISIVVDPLTTIYLSPGQFLENRDVYNLEAIKSFVKVEHDLAEVNPIAEGKQKLFD